MTRLLEIDHVSVGYDGTNVVHDVTLNLNTGVIGCLLGPSGCGKTTLLRSIAGFEPISDGQIRLEGQEVSRPGRTQPPERRQVGMVFQDFALFPHLTVAENIAFGIRSQTAAQRRQRVKELLGLISMDGYGEAYPHALSGGQQQRIAVARAMAPRPRVLLLDEPFSNMDVELREGLAREVRAILKQEEITAMLVTHDQNEAFAFADRIAVIHAGRVLQWDTAYNLYHKPRDRFVADFIGQGRMLPGQVLSEHEVKTELGTITGNVPQDCSLGAPVDVLVRPDDIMPDDDSEIFGEVMDKAFRGASFLYNLQLGSGTRVLCLTPSHYNFALGERIPLKLGFNHLVIFPR
ncbi:ABC transporter ATP-binding protein [Ectothiorhodospira variabilis]|uniref:ABC transporter ATP-binding protein n=1 Tax=Ectothiorhodospira variabilis TaxID=505694 RepID=UPI001EFA7925|nr:ABC transporter ATP-binding protein [Ectothiorhodospira variabilis]MCG5493476.1 ABC transporter ATP-binding protein [Ectothiorhodospira variabilis]MCG5502805.1 ABC transporter ATP-binding protein [Ectothiorhodospira variabilis]MCG5506407.1 ABC transporter ATP-binding protein [Ectothiorhodospira variabilis]